MRSKFQLQRLIKSNEKEFKTFITLTFAENNKDIDIEYANKKFKSFITQVKENKKNSSMFVYLNIKKKRKKFGFRVIHYHLLTNLEIGIDNDIIIPQLTKKSI